jgi:hypothetical protein
MIKMPTDNFEIIKQYLSFESSDDCYVIQIIKRNKDQDPSENHKSCSVKDVFYLYSLEDLDKIKDKCIFIAERYNARVYINLNKKSIKKLHYKL